jgi:hypothetical protein
VDNTGGVLYDGGSLTVGMEAALNNFGENGDQQPRDATKLIINHLQARDHDC